MGSREQNFYNQLACRMGFEDAAQQVQDLYLAKEYRAAAQAVPLEFIDATSLIGPPGRIAERLIAFSEAGVTTLSVSAAVGTVDQRIAMLRGMSEILEKTGLAS